MSEYSQGTESDLRECATTYGLAISADEADEIIAKIKADALRSAARAFEAAEVNLDVIPAKDRELWRGRNEQTAASVASLRVRADRIEEEA